MGFVCLLIKDFESLYGVKVEYNDMNSIELYNCYISENVVSSISVDVLWSLVMDLQVKFVNDGLMVFYDLFESLNVL